MLNVCEIFTSIQGESTQAGRLCSFVRLAGCNLRCKWCDTKHSYDNSMDYVKKSVNDIVREFDTHNTLVAEITGGEPLLQKETVILCHELLNEGYDVLLETNGTQDIGIVPEYVRRIIDVKCPGSGAEGSFLLSNLDHLTETDELKFVLASLDDAKWAYDFIMEHNEIYDSRCATIFSPVTSSLSYKDLADWMIKIKIGETRLGVQLHKIIWGDERLK